MIIPQICNTNQSFNAFIAWENDSGKELKKDEQYTLNRIKAVLDNKQSKHINITGQIIEPHPNDPYRKRVRFITSPLLGDVVKIRAQAGHKDAKPEDYKRNSKWFTLDNGLEWEAIQFINRQISYVRYCTKNPDHTSNKTRGNK